PGEDPGEQWTYQSSSLDGSIHVQTISKGDAVAVNIPVPTPSNNANVSGEVPIPLDLSKIPAGGRIVQAVLAAFGALPVIQLPEVPGAPPSSAPDLSADIAALKRGVNALLAAAGLSPI